MWCRWLCKSSVPICRWVFSACTLIHLFLRSLYGTYGSYRDNAERERLLRDDAALTVCFVGIVTISIIYLLTFRWQFEKPLGLTDLGWSWKRTVMINQRNTKYLIELNLIFYSVRIGICNFIHSDLLYFYSSRKNKTLYGEIEIRSSLLIYIHAFWTKCQDVQTIRYRALTREKFYVGNFAVSISWLFS